MSAPRARSVAMAVLGAFALTGAAAPVALAHGGEEEAPPAKEVKRKPGQSEREFRAQREQAQMSAEEAEVRTLARQPARVLAQQAIAELEVRNDRHEAAVRLDAALESKDRSDVDVARLRQATETLDAGNVDAAIPLLDEALSRPLGSDRGQALHESGRRFSPATGAQEVVGIVAGAALILLGALLLWRSRRVGAHA
jgi:LPXTG-motif cell wall-anchored protein